MKTSKLALLKKYVTVIILILIVAYFGISDKKFMTVMNWISILRQVSMLGIISVGMGCCMLVGDIDLSCGVIEGFGGVICVLLLANAGLPTGLGFILTLILCACVGTLTGFIVVKTGMPALIGTLGMRYIIYGSAYLLSGGTPVYGLTDFQKKIGQGSIGALPIPVFILFVFFILGYILLNKTYIGRYMFAIGSNAESTRLSGINVDRVRIFCFAFSSFSAGVAALIMMGRNSSGQPNAGNGFEMNVITACVVGGVSAMGGTFSIINLAVGVLIVGVLTNGMTILGINDYWQTVITGVVLIAAVGFDFYQKTHTKKVKVDES